MERAGLTMFTTDQGLISNGEYASPPRFLFKVTRVLNMTRINVVPVHELCDQHLLAEFRELTRIPNGILSGKLKIDYDDRPTEYTLGKGHVKFFTNKLPWLHSRYIWLHMECLYRGFVVKNIWPSGNSLGNIHHQVGYIPTFKAQSINRMRIRERWPKNARYCGIPWPDPTTPFTFCIQD